MDYGREDWEVRFFNITSFLKVSFAAVFIGESAKKMCNDGSIRQWPEEFCFYAPSRLTRQGKMLDSTLKLYLPGHTLMDLSESDLSRTVVFNLALLEKTVGQAHESYFEWTFYRPYLHHKLVCMRASEGVLWGFGRQHPFKPHFKPDQRFAGPLVDHRPGSKEKWSFEPIFLRLQDQFSDAKVWKINLRWENRTVALVAEFNPPDIPLKMTEK